MTCCWMLMLSWKEIGQIHIIKNRLKVYTLHNFSLKNININDKRLFSYSFYQVDTLCFLDTTFCLHLKWSKRPEGEEFCRIFFSCWACQILYSEKSSSFSPILNMLFGTHASPSKSKTYITSQCSC